MGQVKHFCDRDSSKIPKKFAISSKLLCFFLNSEMNNLPKKSVIDPWDK